MRKFEPWYPDPTGYNNSTLPIVSGITSIDQILASIANFARRFCIDGAPNMDWTTWGDRVQGYIAEHRNTTFARTGEITPEGRADLLKSLTDEPYLYKRNSDESEYVMRTIPKENGEYVLYGATFGGDIPRPYDLTLGDALLPPGNEFLQYAVEIFTLIVKQNTGHLGEDGRFMIDESSIIEALPKDLRLRRGCNETADFLESLISSIGRIRLLTQYIGPHDTTVSPLGTYPVISMGVISEKEKNKHGLWTFRGSFDPIFLERYCLYINRKPGIKMKQFTHRDRAAEIYDRRDKLSSDQVSLREYVEQNLTTRTAQHSPYLPKAERSNSHDKRIYTRTFCPLIPEGKEYLGALGSARNYAEIGRKVYKPPTKPNPAKRSGGYEGGVFQVMGYHMSLANTTPNIQTAMHNARAVVEDCLGGLMVFRRGLLGANKPPQWIPFDEGVTAGDIRELYAYMFIPVDYSEHRRRRYEQATGHTLLEDHAQRESLMSAQSTYLDAQGEPLIPYKDSGYPVVVMLAAATKADPQGENGASEIIGVSKSSVSRWKSLRANIPTDKIAAVISYINKQSITRKHIEPVLSKLKQQGRLREKRAEYTAEKKGHDLTIVPKKRTRFDDHP